MDHIRLFLRTNHKTQDEKTAKSNDAKLQGCEMGNLHHDGNTPSLFPVTATVLSFFALVSARRQARFRSHIIALRKQ